MEQTQDEGRAARWTFDRTINIPTLLTVIAMVVASVNVFSEQNRRIDAVERTAKGAADDVKRVEAITVAQGQTQVAGLSQLRGEFRDDLRGINGKLDTLLMNQAGVRPETKGWMK